MINNFPIPKLSLVEQAYFIEIVDKILNITNDRDYFVNGDKQIEVEKYRKQIDQMIYKLYGLTPEEIALVEGTSR